MSSRSVSLLTVELCCVDTTTVSTRTGLAPSYSTVTCDLPSGRRYSSTPLRRASDRPLTSLCASMIGSGISSCVSVAGVAEHQPLVAGPAGVHALGDVGGLLMNRREHGAGLGVEAELRARVADILDGVADDLRKIDVTAGRDFAGDDREPGRDERLARHAADGILREDRVENGIGNLVGDLVRVPLGHRLRRKEMTALTAHVRSNSFVIRFLSDS